MRQPLGEDDRESNGTRVAAMVDDPVLRDVLEKITPLRKQITRLILFGSRARGDNRRDSDDDLLIVVPRKDDHLRDGLYEGVMDALLAHGRLISLKIFPEREFERLTRLQTPFMQRIKAEGVPLG